MKRRVRAAFGCIALMVPLVVGVAQLPAAANDIQPFDTEVSTDFVSAGFGGMRGIGTGTLTLAGVSGPVTRALLYWHGPTRSTDPTANALVTFGGAPVTGTQIGFSDNNCWGFTNSQAYRADVTSLVAGDGSYSLANFTKPNAEINGVSLLVFFDDGNPANNRDIVLFDGNDSNIANAFDANGWNTTLSGINYSSGTANLQLHVSDGQSFADDALLLNGMTLAPAGPVFQGNTVPNGAATSGGLWDIRDFDVTPFLTPGPNTLNLTTGVNADCLSLIVVAFDLPAGAAPGTDACALPSPLPPGVIFAVPGQVTIGTAGDDIIIGTEGDDRIAGMGGNDKIYGLGGNDKLSGGDGDDLLCGGNGNDELSGGNGNDKLHGEAGNDDLAGGDGDDVLLGGAGDDRLSGGPGVDVCTGGGQAGDTSALSCETINP